MDKHSNFIVRKKIMPAFDIYEGTLFCKKFWGEAKCKYDFQKVNFIALSLNSKE